jgi:hypothetical protein
MPCWRSSLRVAIKAASNPVDHSSSAFTRPSNLVRRQADVASIGRKWLAIIDGREERLRCELRLQRRAKRRLPSQPTADS